MSPNSPITAAMLYDLVQCTHRPAMDLFGDPAKRDEISPFVRLLWEKGTAYEHEVIEGLELPMLDLSFYAGDEKEQQTFEAMQRGEPLIYSARTGEHAQSLSADAVPRSLGTSMGRVTRDRNLWASLRDAGWH